MAALLLGNEEKKGHLAKIIADGDIFLMAGAGLSMMIGFPSWEGLIKKMEMQVLDKNSTFTQRQKDSESFIEYTNRLVTELGDDFADFISDTFGGECKPLDAHLSLVSSQFDNVV
jgi:hypothetical protein